MAECKLPDALVARLTENLAQENDVVGLLAAAIQFILRKDGEMSEMPDKESVALAVCFYVEAAKLDLAADCLRDRLRIASLSEKHQDAIVDIYKKHKMELRSALLRIGWHPPHVLGVDWSLNYHIKGNVQGVISKPTYLVSLKVQECDSAVPKEINVGCTIEDLQDMVWKLKEATRTVQQTANESISQQ